MRRKKSLLVIHKIQRLFVNTLTANNKHSVLNRDILAQRIQMQLSQQQKTFSELFFAFLKSKFNYKHFLIKMTMRADEFLEILSPKNMV